MKSRLAIGGLLLCLVSALRAAPSAHELPDDTGDSDVQTAAPAASSAPSDDALPAAAAPDTDDAQDAAAPESAPRAAAGFRHSPPEGAYSGVTLTLDVFSPQPIEGGGAMARKVGDAQFTPFPFNKLEDNYYTVDLPGSFVSAPGIEYYLYVEEGGRRRIVWASPIAPVRVRVEGGINTGKELERYRFSHALKAFAESYRFPPAGGKQESDVTEYEVEYVHRFFGPVYAVHYGQGLYETRELTSLSSTALSYEQQPGFFYSFLEVELSPPDSKLTLSLKGMGGALQDQTGGGYEAHLRYGDELGMNVSVGVRGINTLGNAGNLSMRVRPLTWLSLGLGGEMGDMPNGSTMGFREYVDAEFQLQPQVKLLLRGGSAAYNIEQIDGDFGGGLTYEF
jgi:hypothetical protein